MSIAQQIQSWFEKEGSFVAGVHLCRQVGATPALLSELESYFLSPIVPIAIRSKLTYYLQQYLDENPYQEVIAVPKLSAQKEDPIAIQQLRAQAIPLHKEHDRTHALMSAAQTDHERYGYAKKIMEDLLPELDRIYDQIRAFQKTGILPPLQLQPSEKQQLIEAFKKKASIAPRISKLKKLIEEKGIDSKKRAKLEKELLHKELELLKLNTILNDE